MFVKVHQWNFLCLGFSLWNSKKLVPQFLVLGLFRFSQSPLVIWISWNLSLSSRSFNLLVYYVYWVYNFNSVNSVVMSLILFLGLVTWVLPIFLLVCLAKYLSSILLFGANFLFHFFLFSHPVSFISTLFFKYFHFFWLFWGFLIFYFSYFKAWR